MARTGLILDERFQRHVTGAGHPERPERLAHIAEKLKETGLENACQAIDPQPVAMNLVRSVYESAYLDRLATACRDGAPHIDVPDSSICPESYDIAQLAAGSVVRAVDAVMASTVDNAFCAVRPPGHHAERHLSMGFCLLNNVALAAQHLLDAHALERVLIVDFDVHHGNGTQHTFEEDPRVLFVSLHGDPRFVYPGTGYARETGRGDGEGTTLNMPMLPGATDEAYRAAFDDTVLPAAESFNPQFVLISAGFDAHRLDPLAPIDLETDSFGWMTDNLTALARQCCGGRLVSMLEGGYHLDALADSVAVHVTRLLDA